MSLTVTPQPTFWESVPFFFGSVPKKAYPTQEVPGDWCHVAMKKLDSEGKPIEEIFHYVMENSTGDLYGMQEKDHGAPSRLITVLKSTAILMGIPLYTICMIAWRPINFLADICELAMKAPSQFTADFQTKGIATALFNGVVQPICEVLPSFAENISRVVIAPLYALAMAFAALYGMIIPFEGMKLISQIEKSWHGNVSHRSDIRYIRRSWLSTTLCEDFKAARSGTVFYLGYCMQKRGNIHEKIEGKNRFTLVDHPSSEA